MTFLMNSWYCASWSKDLADKPVGIKICDKPIVLFRTDEGNVAALDGRCPHRFAPLALGRVRGDRLECGYHGLQFDRHGVCQLNPHGRGIVPPNAHIRAYPVEERQGAIWIWMGDPALADPKNILDLFFVEGEGWTGLTGYLRIEADYQLVIDNLLDLTHGNYLHPDTLGSPADEGVAGATEFDFRTEGTTVHSNYTLRSLPPVPIVRLFYKQERGDMYALMRWEPASSMFLDVRMVEVGAANDSGLQLPSAHLIVPESATSCHYFYAISRNLELDDTAKTDTMAKMVVKAFTEEDEPVIRQCFEMMGGQALFDLKPAILESDIAAVQARRILDKLVRAEAKAADSVVQAAE